VSQFLCVLPFKHKGDSENNSNGDRNHIGFLHDKSGSL
jgi:hypothetical protein